MRKFLSFAIALMMTATAWAVGLGNGTSQANAIDFDLGNVYVHDAGVTSWYCVDLTQLDATEPALALYLTNRTDEVASVTLSVSATMTLPFVGERAYNMDPVTYNIAGKGHEIWSLVKFNVPVINQELSLKEVLERGLVSKVYLQLTANKQIVVSSKVYEESEIVEDACTKAVDFNWAGESVAAGEKWYYLNLAAVKSGNKKLDFVVENNGTGDAHVAFDLALTCPVSAYVKEYDWTIPAGGNMTEALGRMLLDQLSDDFVYLRLTTDQPLTLSATEQALPAPTTLFDPAGADTLEIGKKYTIDATHDIFVVDMASLKAPKGYKTVCTIESQEASDVVLVQEIAFATPVTNNNAEVKNLTVPANATMQINVASKVVEAIKSDKAYLRLQTDGGLLNLTMQYVELDVVTTPTVSAPSCEKSFVFDWNSSIKHKAYATKWYEFDLSSLKQNGEQVQLSFTNHSDSMVVVMGTILLDCSSKDSIPYALPIPAGKTVSKVFEYSILAASPLERAYVSVTMVPTTITSLADLKSVKTKEDAMALISLNMDTEVELTATKTSALVDPTACEAAPTITKGVTYTQEAGTTKWYRVSDALLDELSFFPEVTFVNNGDKAANITLGTTVGCDYGILTRGTVTVPTWFDLTMTLTKFTGLLVDKLVNQDVTEYYIEVTTDEPIMFGVDIAYGNAFGCDNANEFDWNTGVTLTPRDAKWYHIDLTDLKANEEQVKLTFTNTTNSIAWVAAFLTYECPFRVGLPMIFPVPAGVSVDKWIDYSFIASAPTNDLYLAVYTDTPLEIKAEKETAVITPVTDCVNATVVEPNVQYTILPGTHWYKFSAEPFINTTDTHARLSFANKSGKTAHVTTGATVGCEYGILTRGKLPIPQMEVDVNVPLWVFGLMSKFVDEDVDQYYLEVTTDEELGFMIEVAMPCPDPTYVADTTVVYMCPGTDYVNPYTEATIAFAHDTVLVDTVATEDICLFNVHVVNLTAMQAPEAMTDATLNLIGAVPALTQGLLPDTTGTIAAIKTYYTTNDTEAIADVVSVSWTDVTVAVACDATTHALTLVVEDACGETHTATFNFPVLPAPAVAPDTIHEYICFGTEFEDPYTGIKTTIFEETVIIADTLPTAIPCVDSVVVFVITPVMEPVTMTDSILTLINAVPVLKHGYQPDTTGTLTKILDYYKNNDTDTIADVLSVSWDDVTTPVACGADTHTMTLYVMDACGNNTPMYITFPVEDKTTTETETVTACEAYTWLQNGMTYTTSGIYRDTVASTITGCDSVYHVLNLTVNGPATTQTTDTTICSGDSFTWHGQLVDDSQLLYCDTARYASGCDSVYYVLNLTINTPIETPFIELDTICATETYVWHGQTVDATELSYYDTVRYVGSGCDSAYYELHLTVYNVTLPTITEDDIIAICGNAIDVTVADSIILAHIASDPLYAAVTSVTWEVNINGTWTALTSDAIDGNVTQVTLRYTVHTACEDVTSADIVVTNIQTPTPENDLDMTDVPAYNNYGGRLLTVDIKQIKADFGWDVAAEQVTWYMVVEGGTDQEMGKGFYLANADGTPLQAGIYYARVSHTATEASDCDGILQTVDVVVATTAEAPKLVPTVARPNELIQVLNLNADAVSTISVYSTTGELMHTFQVANQENATFPAAQLTGYYVVEVLTETEKVSLRYIVK